MKVYAFDVDDTLWVSNGPVTLGMCEELMSHGHVLGLFGNWAMVVQNFYSWHWIFHFLGPMAMTKDNFLSQIKQYMPAEDYIMVGNIPGRGGPSNDKLAAELAGWRFIEEVEFANGQR